VAEKTFNSLYEIPERIYRNYNRLSAQLSILFMRFADYFNAWRVLNVFLSILFMRFHSGKVYAYNASSKAFNSLYEIQ